MRDPTGEGTKPGNPQEAWTDAFSPLKFSADFLDLLWRCFAAVQYLLDMSNDENIYDVEHCQILVWEKSQNWDFYQHYTNNTHFVVAFPSNTSKVIHAQLAKLLAAASVIPREEQPHFSWINHVQTWLCFVVQIWAAVPRVAVCAGSSDAFTEGAVGSPAPPEQFQLSAEGAAASPQPVSCGLYQAIF